MKSNDKLIRINPDEYDLILEWGNQFVLMAKEGFITADQLKVQKSQQLIDDINDPKVTEEMEMILKTFKEQIEVRKEVVDKVRYKDHPEMTIEDQIGETYEGE